MKWVRWFGEIGLADVPLVGGKNASLGEMLHALGPLGIHVPGVTFREVHETNGHTRIGFSGYWRDDNDNAVLRRFLDFVAVRYSQPPIPGRPPSSQQPGKEPS